MLQQTLEHDPLYLPIWLDVNSPLELDPYAVLLEGVVPGQGAAAQACNKTFNKCDQLLDLALSQ